MLRRRKYEIVLTHSAPQTPIPPPLLHSGSWLAGRWFGLFFFGLMIASYISFAGR